MEIARLDLMQWTETFLDQWLESRADPKRREELVQNFLITWLQIAGTLGERLDAWREEGRHKLPQSGVVSRGQPKE